VGPTAGLDGRKISSPPGFDPGPSSPTELPGPYMYDNTSLNSAWNGKCFIQTLYKKSKHSLWSPNFFPENLVLYEILWKNMVEPDFPL